MSTEISFVTVYLYLQYMKCIAQEVCISENYVCRKCELVTIYRTCFLN